MVTTGHFYLPQASGPPPEDLSQWQYRDVQIDNFPFIYDARVQNKYLSVFAVSLLR